MKILTITIFFLMLLVFSFSVFAEDKNYKRFAFKIMDNYLASNKIVNTTNSKTKNRYKLNVIKKSDSLSNN